ncbi:17841_t:CDS:1, partial [Funneliformis geosporum]
ADKTKRYIAETILEELNNMATEGHFDISDVLKFKTIHGWITTYAAVLKIRNAEKALAEGDILNQNSKKRRL